MNKNLPAIKQTTEVELSKASKLMDVANKILSEKSTIQASEANLSIGDKRTTWYDSGQIEFEAHYINGKLDGKYTRWYRNGTKWIERNFINGKEDGKSTEWHNNAVTANRQGTIYTVAYYENGELVN